MLSFQAKTNTNDTIFTVGTVRYTIRAEIIEYIDLIVFFLNRRMFEALNKIGPMRDNWLSNRGENFCL